MQSAGSPLDQRSREFVEQHSGRDVSQVRVHTGEQASEAAEALHAAAFTVGNDIVFARDRYSPSTAAGRLLLLHELKHVEQQRSAARASNLRLDPPASSEEHQARSLLDPNVRPLAVQRVQCAPEGEQFSIGEAVADSVGRSLFGDAAWPFLKAVFEGFVGGIKSDVAAGRADEANEHLVKLLIPLNALKFNAGYVVGFVIGLVSPITDLVKGIIGVVRLSISALEWLAKWSPIGVAVSPERQQKIIQLITKFNELGNEWNKALAEFMSDPQGTIKKFTDFLDNLMQLALGKAHELGAKAAHSIFDLLKKDFFDMGKSMGEVIGALIAQVLLLVFSDAIGNLITKGASVLGKAAEFVAGTAVEIFEWVKGFASEVGAMIRSALKGALKMFEGLGNKLMEAVDSFVALFTDAAQALDAGGEKVAAGVGRVGSETQMSNVMESRMVTAERTTPAKAADLAPSKVHPSNVKTTPPKSTEVGAVSKVNSAALQYRDTLIKRFPDLAEAELKPIARDLGQPGLWEESIYTGSGRSSWSAKLRNGTKIQLDDIDQAGVVVDTKMRDIGVGREIPPQDIPDVVTQMGEKRPVVRKYETFSPKEQAQLEKQLKFVQENGLTGVRWETNSADLLEEVNRYKTNLLSKEEQKLFKVVLVQR
ncbi:MAG: DUF4157 domain-containing protein [Candidatus Sulfotelmatobacter sp.]